MRTQTHSAQREEKKEKSNHECVCVCVCESTEKTEFVSYTNGAKWENSPSMLWQIMPIYNRRKEKLLKQQQQHIENQVSEHIWITNHVHIHINKKGIYWPFDRVGTLE